MCKVNAFLPHKRKICIIFTIYDADSDKMMQIKCPSNGTRLISDALTVIPASTVVAFRQVLDDGLPHHITVDLGRGDIAVPQELLHGRYAYTIIYQ